MEPVTTGAGMALSTKIILAIVGIAVVGGVGYSVATKDSSPTTDGEDTPKDGEMFAGDIFGLVGRGGDWKCTWSFDQDGVVSEGTVWVSGDNFKSEAQVVAGGMNMTATAIGDGEYMYSWTSGMPNGMKFKLDEAERMADDPSTSGQAVAQTENFAQEYNYNCEKWRADRGTFDIPSSITFTDFSAMMQGGFDAQGSANIDIEALMQQYQTQ